MIVSHHFVSEWFQQFREEISSEQIHRFVMFVCTSTTSGISKSGHCYTFGHNGFGNLGNGTYTTWGEGENTPYRIESDHTFVDASCGMFYFWDFSY